MRQTTQPLRILVTIEFKDFIDCPLLRGTQLRDVAWFILFGDGELSSRHVKQRLADGAVSPGGEILVEQRRVIPDQRPCLCVVAQFLQLHGRHLASLMQNVFGYVKNRCFHCFPWVATHGWGTFTAAAVLFGVLRYRGFVTHGWDTIAPTGLMIVGIPMPLRGWI